MSDPVTNAEVEDVLSSIRRLVSEDKRPLQAPKVTQDSDRLVLTPALRVADEPQDEENLLEEFPAPEEDAEKAVDTSIDSLVSDDRPLDMYPDRPSHPIEMEVDAEGKVKTRDPADDYSDDPYNFDEDDEVVGEPAPHEVSHAEALRDLQRSEDPDPEPVRLEEVVQQAVEEDVSERVQEVVAEEFADETLAHDEGAEDEHSDAPAQEVTLSAKIEALETAIGNISDNFEPEDTGDGDYAGTEPDVMEWEDNDEPEAPEPRLHFAPLVEPEKSAEPFPPQSQEDGDVDQVETSATSAFVLQNPEEPEVPETVEPVAAAPAELEEARDQEPSAAEQPEPTSVPLDDDPQLIDEEALRDLVSEIVRSELQGALGERITRNVRKLVRREIHRALTAQDLE